MAASNLRDSRILRDFSIWINGVGKLGMCAQVTLPEINIQMEDFRGGGMDGSVEIPMGLEKMDMSFEMFSWDEDLWNNLGYGAGSMDMQFKFLGATMTAAGTEEQVKIDTIGSIKNLKTDTIESGKKVKTSAGIACRYYRHTIASKVVTEIDVFRKIFTINGNDASSTARQNLGFTY